MVSSRPRLSSAVVLGAALALALPAMLLAAPRPTPTPSAIPATAAAPDPSPTPTPVAVTLKGSRFEPSTLTVVVGQTVEFTNADKIQHTVTEINGAWDSGTLENGQKWQQTFTKAGTVEYLCGFHPMMRGKIVVQSGPPSPRPVSTLSLTPPLPTPTPNRLPPND